MLKLFSAGWGAGGGYSLQVLLPVCWVPRLSDISIMMSAVLMPGACYIPIGSMGMSQIMNSSGVILSP